MIMCLFMNQGLLKYFRFHEDEKDVAMIRVKGLYRNQTLELDQPLALSEGTMVKIDIDLAQEAQDEEKNGWREMGMSCLEEEWDHPEDVVYNNWK